MSRYHTPAPSAGPAPSANSTLINGLGRYADGPSSPLAVITVTRGKLYRFRLVSLSCDPDFIFSVDGHTLVRFNYFVRTMFFYLFLLLRRLLKLME
jgi:iron transport multicopper oxidase